MIKDKFNNFTVFCVQELNINEEAKLRLAQMNAMSSEILIATFMQTLHPHKVAIENHDETCIGKIVEVSDELKDVLLQAFESASDAQQEKMWRYLNCFLELSL